MVSKIKNISCALIVLASIIIIPRFGFAVPRYTVTDLGTLGSRSSVANAINNEREIVGYLREPDRAFHWKDGIMTVLEGDNNTAHDINDLGQIVGSMTVSVGGWNEGHAILWDNGEIIDLGHLNPGIPNSVARAINNFSQIVGESGGKPFLWDNDVLIDLSTTKINPSGRPRDINDYLEIVGSGAANSSWNHAFLWDHAFRESPSFTYFSWRSMDLGTLAGELSHISTSYANAMNNQKQIVGASHTPERSGVYPFLWQDGTMINLGTLGGNGGEAQGINEDGVVVGFSFLSVEGGSAFIYYGGVMYDLNKRIDNPDFILSIAYDINDNGEIVGMGVINEEQHAFLLTPIEDTDDDGDGGGGGGGSICFVDTLRHYFWFAR